MATSTKIGHGLAKFLGIKLNYRNELSLQDQEIQRGESTYSSQSTDVYVEQEPRSIDWVVGVLPSGQDLVDYARDLFPFLHWAGRYNAQWLVGDLIAGAPLLRSIYIYIYIYIMLCTDAVVRHHRGLCGRSPRNGICCSR
jgi:hypothetical protein